MNREQIDKIIIENQALIYKTIKMLNLKWTTEDEFQAYYDAGLDGLIKAANSYNESKGKVSTWCMPCIKNEILHYLTVKTYKKNMNEYGRDISLNYIINEDDEHLTECGDLIPDPNVNIETEIEKKYESERLIYAINQLKNEKDKIVIKMYYGLDGYKEESSCDEIAEMFNVSKQAINARLNRAKNDLKQFYKKEQVKESKINIPIKKKQEVRMMERTSEPNNKKVNTLSDLNNILFQQLQDLDNDTKDFETQIRKSYAVSQIAQQIIANTNTCIKAMKMVKENDIKDNNQLEFLGLKSK